MIGNGYSTGPAVNFGIGLLATAANNLVEANSASGNANGIVLFLGAAGNAIRQNLVIGNPPIQVSNSVSGATGADIWDQNAPGSNAVIGNLCVTGINAKCPSVSTQAAPRRPAR